MKCSEISIKILARDQASLRNKENGGYQPRGYVASAILKN
jgi:hypothetical protein